VRKHEHDAHAALLRRLLDARLHRRGALLVRDGSPVRKLADLGVEGGTTTEPRLLELLRERSVAAKVERLRDNGEGIAKLGSGAIDALAGDRLELAGLTAHANDPRAYELLPEDLSVELIAFALPRNDAAFRLEVNRALGEIYRSDIEHIFQQWLGAAPTASWRRSTS